MSINISIIFPIFSDLASLNYFKNQSKSLDSLSLSTLEIVVINDNSPYLKDKEIKEIISEIPNNISLKYLKLKKNKGPGHVRNLGIKQSNSHKYICFVDDDDKVNLQNILKVSKYSDTDFVISPIYNSQNFNFINNKYYSFLGLWLLFFLGYVKTVAWNKIYKKSFLFKNNIYFSEYYLFEDEKFLINLLSSHSKNSYSFTKYPFVNMNKRIDSRSRSFKFISLLTYILVQLENFRFLIKKDPNLLPFWLLLFLPKSTLSVCIAYFRSFYLRRARRVCNK
ncbi:glycosyltransferase family 2 protein [Prochlorococcus sp. AH-716-I07]|nr:glycosyltransferase family 2 protein [Prochlorococcus sp. AH-716-I07]